MVISIVIAMLTYDDSQYSNYRYKLTVTVRVADGTFRYVTYDQFYIESESNGYKLRVNGASDGPAGLI